MSEKLDPQSPAFSPQNPYKSWLVSASAGSGKTYQLSRRFLHLVAAGAEPSSILTVTFTIKAAAEMRLRILEDAARLTNDEAFAKEFAAASTIFHAPYKGRKPPPLLPKTAGDLILKASQSLKITTIDAIFLEWVARFPHEAGADPAGQQTIPAPFNLANRLDEEMFRATAWKALCRHISGKLDSGDDPFLIEQLSSEKLSGLRKLIQELQSMDTYLWHEEMVSGSAFTPSDLDQVEDLPNDDSETEELLLESIEDEISAVACVISNRGKADAILTALAERSLSGLQSATLFTKSWTLNGQTVSKKVRDQLPLEIAKIEGEILRYGDLKKLRYLNKKGALSYQLYQLYRFFYNQLRFSRNAAEFSDLVKGSFALFNSAGSLGVKYLLTRTIHHLMLDEFQDTSILQWSVFKEITDHLLAGESMDIPPGADPSLFVVGDEKQSIYGFREADPEVMTFIRESYAEQIEIAPLNESFRTANVVLSFVNNAFKDLVPDFPTHRTAETDGKVFIPNHGQVGILKTLPTKKTKPNATSDKEDSDNASDDNIGPENGKDEGLTVAAQEADAIAGLLKHALTHNKDFPVYDKRKKTWRPLNAEDCAVLYRSGTHAGLYEEAIRRQDIPCQREEEKGFFARPEISDVLALLQYLATPADLVALLTLVKSPIVSIPDPISFKALEEVQREGHKGPVHSNEYLNALKKYCPEFVSVLSDLLQSATNTPPHELILSCYRKLNIIHAYSKGPTQTENEARLAEINLIALASRALKADSEGMSTLFDVCRYFASLKELDEIGNAATAGDAVRLMTIHKSKGLEYPFLIVADIGRSFAKGDVNWTQVREKSGLRREDKVIFSGTKSDRPIGEHWDLSRNVKTANIRTIQEAHRLLYVALTRAQHYLFITGHEPSSGGGLKETLYHQHLVGALATADSKDVVIHGSTYSVRAAETAELNWSPASVNSQATSYQSLTFAPFAKGTDQLKSEMVLVSPSQLEKTKGKTRSRGQNGWQQLLRQEFLPPKMTAAIGTLIHRGVEYVLSDRRFDLTEELAKLAISDEASMRAANELYEKVQRSSVLPRFAKQPCQTEVNVAALIEDKIVRGSIDLITEEADGSILVVDYKTTRFELPLPENHKRELDLLKKFMKDRGYDEQVKLYCQAMRQIHPGRTVRGAVWFIDWDLLVVERK